MTKDSFASHCLIKIVVVGILISIEASNVSCKINLFLDKEQTSRILGYDGQLFYIRNGVPNKNAISYKLPIPYPLDQIVLTWQNLYPPFHIAKLQASSVKPQPVFMLYGLNMRSSDQKILRSPYSNITSTGTVPQTETGFSISTKCVAGQEGEIPLYLNINITVIDPSLTQNQSFKLHFHFNKLCRKVIAPVIVEKPSPNGKSKSSGSIFDNVSILNIGVTMAGGFFLAMAATVVALHIKSMPKPSDSKDVMSPGDSVSQIGSTLPRSQVTQASMLSAEDKFRRDVRLRLRDLTIPRTLVSFGNIIQEGAYGRVFIGSLISRENGEEQRVFVKTVTEQATPEQANVFLVESSLMKRTNHRHVLPIMHVCLEEGLPPLVILPYLNRGSLKNYLRLSRTAEPLSKTLTTRDIVFMAIQISRGLQYLTKRKIVHRDVASRNCV